MVAQKGGMTGLVRQTYLILGKNNFKLGGRKLWVRLGCAKNLFTSVDGKGYNLHLSKKRPKEYCIPYELFIEDESNV